MPKTEKHQCVATVYPKEPYGSFHGHKCTWNATIQREDKWYCGKHDPEKIKERFQKRNAEWDRQRENDNKHQRRLNAEHHYCEGLTTEYLEQHQANAEMN